MASCQIIEVYQKNQIWHPFYKNKEFWIFGYFTAYSPIENQLISP